MKKNYRFSVLLLSLLLMSTLFAGCTGSSSRQLTDRTDTVPMGRYVEEELTLPPGASSILAMHILPDGTLAILTSDQNSEWSEYVEAYRIFHSQDNGDSWAEHTPDWFSQLSKHIVLNASFDEEGALHMVCFSPYQGTDFSCTIISVAPDGSRTDFVSDEAMPTAVQHAQNGDYYIVGAGPSIKRYDENRQFVQSFDNNDYPAAYRIYGDTLATVDGRTLSFYDLATGQRTDTVQLPYSYSSSLLSSGLVPGSTLQYSAEEDCWYYCDSSGIYRISRGSSLLEKLVNGDLTSMTRPSAVPYRFVLSGETFLVACSNTGADYSLLRYSWSDTTPAVPAVELRLYMLYDSPTVRQAISFFQRENPDVYVTYEIGLETDSAMTPADAIRNLNTQLLSGTGPDILLLDGLPVEALVEKGVLLDLSSWSSRYRGSGELLENIAFGFQQEDGTLYGIPVRFTIPILQGESAVTGGFGDSVEMMHWIADMLEANTSIDEEFPTDPELLFALLYPTAAPVWLDQENGTINSEEIARFLEAMKRIVDAEKLQPEGRRANRRFTLTEASCWRFGRVLLNLGEASAAVDLYYPFSAMREKGDGVPQLMPGQVKGAYYPKGVFAVSSSSPRQELALGLLSTALSQQTQDYPLQDGLPVNAASFKTALSDPSGNAWLNEQPIDVTFTDGTVMTMIGNWPTDKEWDFFRSLVDSLETPVMVNPVIYGIIQQQAIPYLTEGGSLERTINAISRNLQLYLME